MACPRFLPRELMLLFVCFFKCWARHLLLFYMQRSGQLATSLTWPGAKCQESGLKGCVCVSTLLERMNELPFNFLELTKKEVKNIA